MDLSVFRQRIVETSNSFLLDLLLVEDFVDDAVVFGFFGRHVEIAIGILGDPLDGLAGVRGEDAVEHLAGLEDFLGLDLDVGDLAAHLPVGLMDHHLGVGQREALALGAAGQQHRPAAGGQSHAVGGHGATEDLHRVVNRQG